MIRMNSTGPVTVEQEITWNLKQHTLTHIVTFHHGEYHIYKRFETDDFNAACVAFDLLETLIDYPTDLLRIEHFLDTIEHRLDEIAPLLDPRKF